MPPPHPKGSKCASAPLQYVAPHDTEQSSSTSVLYCKFGNFREHFIFANSVKRDICHIKNSRLGHDIPTSVNDSDIAISRGFYFHETSHMRSFAKITLAKFPNFQYWSSWKDVNVLVHESSVRSGKSLWKVRQGGPGLKSWQRLFF